MTTTNDSINLLDPQTRTFLETLVARAHLTPLPEGVRDAMILELADDLNAYMAAGIVQHLGDTDVQTFIKMNEENKPQDELQDFLNAHIPDASTVFAQVLNDFASSYLEGVEKSKQARDAVTETETQTANPPTKI